ncbi:uncharacterized protein DS421_1g31800 [Arachis hypogaea]|uniref:CCHC-type domain-containing protein n=1 Tax=Arachis hypogaea TaxID=3818 RepID=A0A445EJI7_ARAHY|nr:uncharacterized protein LOC114924324 [Arachis hypogaea]QHO51547.1 uncharacterized protein DS421_1g31800 [Arachis hypogaea]RYR75635.1 hypothetical protein Ahy_A01g000208 [Arachis hypogaea]
MAKERSASVSTQEFDLIQRSKKKVKDRERVDLNQPGDSMEEATENFKAPANNSKVSYKESLLSIPGSSVDPNEEVLEPIDEDASDPEDRWYKEVECKEDKPFDACPTIPISKDEFEEWCKPWHAALIVKVLGKRVHLGFMKQRLNRDWAKKGQINVIDMDRDYFLVHFTDEEDYNHALVEGPWMITSHYLIVQRWRPFFLASENIAKKIATWIRIPNLPIELYNHRFLSRVGSTLGTMLKIDRATSVHSRGRFARICVELGLSKKLVPRILVLGQILNVEYEDLHLICFTCGKYGHQPDQCSEMHDGKVAPKNTTIDGEEGSPGFAGEEGVNHANITGQGAKNQFKKDK